MNIHINEFHDVACYDSFTLCYNILNDFNVNMLKNILSSKQTNDYM
jgi:hypothetical protein